MTNEETLGSGYKPEPARFRALERLVTYFIDLTCRSRLDHASG